MIIVAECYTGINYKGVTLAHLSKRYQDMVEQVPGTDHWQIENGENEFYEEVNDAVEQTTINDRAVNFFIEVTEQTELGVLRGGGYGKISRRVLRSLYKAFKEESYYEKSMFLTETILSANFQIIKILPYSPN